MPVVLDSAGADLVSLCPVHGRCLSFPDIGHRLRHDGWSFSALVCFQLSWWHLLSRPFHLLLGSRGHRLIDRWAHAQSADDTWRITCRPCLSERRSPGVFALSLPLDTLRAHVHTEQLAWPCTLGSCTTLSTAPSFACSADPQLDAFAVDDPRLRCAEHRPSEVLERERRRRSFMP